ncbi:MULTISPECIES: hypothetical protein [unclassified Streptomyces]|uniref:hypothetical protein n=1 Tax=unclassified Streptomyces TaxID=2593676 RepID=UPI00381FCE28
MLFGSRAGSGLEFHVERDPQLLCVDVFLGGLHVNTWDNAFYPPLLVRKLGDELGRLRAPTAPPVAFASPSAFFRLAERRMRDDAGAGIAPEVRAALARYEFLDWGECTNEVKAFAFPEGDHVHLACRMYEGSGVAGGAEDPREPTMVSVSRAVFVEMLERSLVVAEREWSARLAVLTARRDARDGGDASGRPANGER